MGRNVGRFGPRLAVFLSCHDDDKICHARSLRKEQSYERRTNQYEHFETQVVGAAAHAPLDIEAEAARLFAVKVPEGFQTIELE